MILKRKAQLVKYLCKYIFIKKISDNLYTIFFDENEIYTI